MKAAVSIIISNYNYARYLPDAIESALGQQGVDVEVVVVDDASTDESWTTIESYGSSIQAARQRSNAGQAAAVNTGFRLARGDVVHFLDADDWLEPHAAGLVAQAFAERPDAARVQFRLGHVDGNGVSLPGTTPPQHRRMPDGDLRSEILRYPHDVRCPPMSGNAYRRRVLERILPIPEAEYGAVLADLYLLNLTPLYGDVVSLDQVLGRYRVHGGNAHHRTSLDLAALRGLIERNQAGDAHVRRRACELGLDPDAGDGRGQLSVTDLAARLVSLRLDPEGHPRRHDSRASLVSSGIWAAKRRDDAPVWRRAGFAAWFAAAGAAPKPLVERLAQRTFAAR